MRPRTSERRGPMTISDLCQFSGFPARCHVLSSGAVHGLAFPGMRCMMGRARCYEFGMLSEGGRLPVAGLPLPARPGPDEPAGISAGSQPVAEVLPGDRSEQLDIGLEAWDQRLPLIPGQRLSRRGIPPEDPLEMVDED